MPNPTNASSTLHVLFGPVAAGKSTYGITLAAAQRAPFFMLDRWMAELFGDDERPTEGRLTWYLERRARCLTLMLETCRNLVDCGGSVVVEPSLVQESSRRSFFEAIEDWPCEVVVHVIDAPLEVRRSRVERRNQEQGATYSMTVPMEIFEQASAMWEPLTDEEQQRMNIRWLGNSEDQRL